MSNDKLARSVALEQAYVHDVYEQFCENSKSQPWPRVQEFIESLEPGSLVCDVGCGNGKYLNVSTSIFNIGGEKSKKLCKIAKEQQQEVLLLDNLALPFRDESLDAVLSIAVVHHFATTERRVCALRELARVLRIGGRLIISVWSMEQNHRKFESQDVLVPWHRHRHMSTPSLDLSISTTNTSEEDDALHYHACDHISSNECGKTNNRSKKRGKTRRTVRTIEPPAQSPGSGSLSSPNETCYSFVRRAIQKLAGGRRIGNAHRPWFLDTWSSNKDGPPSDKRYDPDGCECCCECDAQDLPIELRRVDEDDLPQRRRQTFPSSQITNDINYLKSRSLTNITNANDLQINHQQQQQQQQQQQHIIVTDETTNESLANSTTNLITSSSDNLSNKRHKLVKQKKSICEDEDEELVDSVEGLLLPTQEAKSYRFIKQRSLNEELMSAERIQEKEKLRRNIQKQASLNEELIYHHQKNYSFDNFRENHLFTSTAKRLQIIRTGFNKIKASSNMQGTGTSLKNGFVRMFQHWKSTELLSPQTIPEDETATVSQSHQQRRNPQGSDNGERRSSKEDGSDSSKDSSLQSDTSVDSEDSFASVIFVPKSNPMSPTATLSPGPTSPRVNNNNNTSVPNSPRIKQSSCPTSPRIKQMPLSIYPLTKQLSSPKPSTVSILSPTDCKTQVKANQAKTTEKTTTKKPSSLAQKYQVVAIPKFNAAKRGGEENRRHSCENNKSNELADKEENIRKIKELLNSKPGFGMKTTKSASNYPIVRHSSVSNGKTENIAKPLPKMLSLELFNPETDDKDSDSSAVSSPDSVDSVISVNSESAKKFRFPEIRQGLQERSALLQAARDVAESLDSAVERVIRSSPRLVAGQRSRENKTDDVQSSKNARRYSINNDDDDRNPLLGPDWNDEECHRHLSDFADKLSEKLLHEIDQYQLNGKDNNDLNAIKHIDEPYIHRLSEELQDLSKLSAEIQKQNEYLAKLSASDKQLLLTNNCLLCKQVNCVCVNEPSRRSRVAHQENNTTSAGQQQQKFLHKISNSSSGNKIEDATIHLVRPNLSKSGTGTSSMDSCDSSCSPNYTNSNESTEDTISRYSDIGTGSTASLASCPEWKTIRKNNSNNNNNKMANEGMHSASFDDNKSLDCGKLDKSNLIPSLSDTSQESLPSDNVGGEITYHRYYHVFREGELDQLIEKYVENLHIISSYYDHASWCVVAEKVQVWTI